MERLNRNRKRVEFVVGLSCIIGLIGLFSGLFMWVWADGSIGWKTTVTSWIFIMLVMFVNSLLKRVYDDIEKEAVKQDPKPARKSKFEERLGAYMEAKKTSN